MFVQRLQQQTAALQAKVTPLLEFLLHEGPIKPFEGTPLCYSMEATDESSSGDEYTATGGLPSTAMRGTAVGLQVPATASVHNGHTNSAPRFLISCDARHGGTTAAALPELVSFPGATSLFDIHGTHHMHVATRDYLPREHANIANSSAGEDVVERRNMMFRVGKTTSGHGQDQDSPGEEGTLMMMPHVEDARDDSPRLSRSECAEGISKFRLSATKNPNELRTLAHQEEEVRTVVDAEHTAYVPIELRCEGRTDAVSDRGKT